MFAIGTISLKLYSASETFSPSNLSPASSQPFTGLTINAFLGPSHPFKIHSPAADSHEGRQATMIELSRLNGHPIVVNAELIKFVEQNPDTVITLVTGDKLVVRQAASEIMQRVLAYRRLLLHPEAMSLSA